MTTKKDLKKHIRARQAKTGESYTAARSHIIRARDSRHAGQAPPAERITAIVLKCNEQSIRIRRPNESDTITLRLPGYHATRVAPGQFVDAMLTNRWVWDGATYANGRIERAWTDVPALGLDPLPLEDRGAYDLNEIHEPFQRPDPYAEMWEVLASTPRQAFEFSGVAWGAAVGVEAEDHEACLVADAAEIASYDPHAARKLLMQALLADLRCIDAHAHLGNLAFDRRPEDAITHYDIAIRIGELSLGAHFNDLLPWGHIFNRPFLRALHGYGLCLWRLDRAEKALAVFERLLSLNPADNQGIRFCWDDIRNGRPWQPDEPDIP
jgi:tetratricopeptide (TPR) repeat protein